VKLSLETVKCSLCHPNLCQTLYQDFKKPVFKWKLW